MPASGDRASPEARRPKRLDAGPRHRPARAIEIYEEATGEVADARRAWSARAIVGEGEIRGVMAVASTNDTAVRHQARGRAKRRGEGLGRGRPAARRGPRRRHR